MSQTPSLLYEYPYRQVGRKNHSKTVAGSSQPTVPLSRAPKECLARLLETTDSTFPPLPFISFILFIKKVKKKPKGVKYCTRIRIIL